MSKYIKKRQKKLLKKKKARKKKLNIIMKKEKKRVTSKKQFIKNTSNKNNNLKKDFNLEKYLIKFDFIETYFWLVTSSIHPSNHKYFIRYEYLIHLLLSIPKEHFSNQPITESEFKFLIEEFEKSSNFFYLYEDITPLNQKNLIPLFIENKRYYLFYGLMDRVFEYTSQVIDIFLESSINPIKDFFIDSLSFQTQILENFKSENFKDKNKMLIPSKKFKEKYSIFFKVNNNLQKKLYTHENKNYNIEINNFNGLYINNNNEYFYLPPQNHIEIIYSKIKSFIQKDKINFLEINENYSNRLNKLVFNFFYSEMLINKLLKTDKTIITSYFENIIKFRNQIFLFKTVKHNKSDYESDIFESKSNFLSKKINNISQRALKELKKIESEKTIRISYMNTSNHEIYSKDFEFIIILVYETANIDYVIQKENNNILLINFIDLKIIFEFLNNKLDFFQDYINFERNNTNNKFLGLSTIFDRFLYFYNNNFIDPNQKYIIFDSDYSRDYYHSHLLKKYSDNIYYLINSSSIDLKDFNLIETNYNNIYRFFNPCIHQELILIKNKNRIIQIQFPPYLLFDDQDKINILNVFSECIAYYLEIFLSKNKNILTNNLSIGMFPTDYLKETYNFNQGHPINISKITGQDNEFIIYYNSEFILNFCRLNQNINYEKIIIRKILNTIFTKKEIITLKNIFNGKKFSFTTINTLNPLFKDYVEPFKKKDKYIIQINNELKGFLKEKYKIGKYEGDKAKELNNDIAYFLQQKLENEIKLFNKDILISTYQQIEFIEGKREHNVNQAALDYSKDTEFNVMKKHEYEREEYNQLSIATKHILHTILKVNPQHQGNKLSNENTWSYLLALSIIINETLYISDSFHYSLINPRIIITENYKIKDEVNEKKINIDKFNSAIALQQVNSIKVFINKKGENKAKESNIFPIDKDLKIAFNNQYGFKIENMLTILIFLSGNELENYRIKFPLHLLPKKELTNLIIKNINNLLLKENEINRIIDFLSIEHNSLKNCDIVCFSLDKMYRNPNRINIKPLIIFKDKILFGNQQVFNSYKLWFDYLLRAELPYIPDENSIIKKAMNSVHEKQDKELEKKAYKLALDVLGEKNLLLNFKKASKISPKLPNMNLSGEIDLLAVNKNRKIIFVLDAKNMNRKLYPSGIKNELKKFFENTKKGKNKSYLYHLRAKSQYVLENLEIFLDFFEIKDKKSWKVIDGFIVNTIYFSEFYYGEKVNFIDIGNLQEYLTK